MREKWGDWEENETKVGKLGENWEKSGEFGRKMREKWGDWEENERKVGKLGGK